MRTLAADYRVVKGPTNRFWRDCAGAGRAGELLRKAAVDQLREARTECGFEYLRFHGLFHEDMAVYQEDDDGRPVYNWQYVDMVYDEILAAGMKPLVELAFMPVAMASGDKTVFWWKANVTPPKSMDAWAELVRRVTVHWTDRYGADEVARWRFEVWNEPNHPAFFSAGLPEYLAMYEAAARAVKGVDARYKVGGPATAGNAWAPEIIAFCVERGVPLDFISTHAYAVRGDFDADGKSQLYLVKNPLNIVEEVAGVRAEIDASARPDLPLYYTEWSASYSSRDPIHDHYVHAAFTLFNLKRLDGVVDAMSYWTFTDVFEEMGPGLEPLHGGFGLLNLQGLRKPAFYAYQFLNALGDVELVQDDPDAWICRNPDGEPAGVQILCWHYQRPEQDDANNRFFHWSRDWAPPGRRTVRLDLAGLPAGRYRLEGRQVGYKVNDLQAEYRKRNFTDTPTREAVAELRTAVDGRPVLEEIVTVNADGRYARDIELRDYDCLLLRLIKAD